MMICSRQAAHSNTGNTASKQAKQLTNTQQHMEHSLCSRRSSLLAHIWILGHGMVVIMRAQKRAHPRIRHTHIEADPSHCNDEHELAIHSPGLLHLVWHKDEGLESDKRPKRAGWVISKNKKLVSGPRSSHQISKARGWAAHLRPEQGIRGLALAC